MLFLDQFHKLTITKENASKLKAFVLQLAVQGRLTEKWRKDHPEVKPASVLLEKIKKEKELLIKEKKIRKEKPLLSITEEEIPFELPDGWVWCRLGDLLMNITGGGTPSKRNANYWGGDIPWASVKDLKDFHYLRSTVDSITEDGLNNCSSNLIPKGNVIVCTRMGLGKVVLNEIDVAINQDLKALFLNNSINREFFYNLYKTLEFKGTGMTVKGIRQDDLLKIPTPLMTNEEQHQIVCIVNQLISKIEELEEQTKERVLLKKDFVISALNQVTSPSKGQTIQENWSIVLNNFHEFFNEVNTIRKLKETILQLSIQGKLTKQWRKEHPDLEPASVLLERIKKEKERLIKEKKIRKEKPLPPITNEEMPFELPDGWVWCRLQQLVSVLGDGIHGTPSYDQHGEYYFINGNNLTDGVIEIKQNTKRVNQAEFLKHSRPLDKTTLMVSINGTIGNTAYYNNEKVMLGKSACFFNLLNGTNKEYIRAIIKSRYFINYAYSQATGTTIKNVSLRTMRSFIIPLPSIQEQTQIISIVKQLIKQCDDLEEKSNDIKVHCDLLMRAALNEAIKGK